MSKTVEQTVNELLPCTCDIAYTKIDMAAPDCPQCNYAEDLIKALTPSPDVAGSDGVALKIAINALQSIDAYDDVADPPFTPKQFGDIARKALGKIVALQSQPKPTKGVDILLERLAKEGGQIVSTAGLSQLDITQAQSCGRMYVDDNNLGFVWFPSHPQPAGASVEQAAHDYVEGMLGDYDPELQEEYDAILAHVLKGVELAGAVFQSSQVVGEWKRRSFMNVLQENRKAIQGSDEKIAFPGMSTMEAVDEVYSDMIELYEAYETAQQPAPGIPAVRELVDLLKAAQLQLECCAWEIDNQDYNTVEESVTESTCNARNSIVIARRIRTALAGFKQK